MAQIILTDEQMRELHQGQGRIAIRDPQNHLLGYLQLAHFTAEDIEEARRRLASDQPRHTTAQVMAHLRSLESK